MANVLHALREVGATGQVTTLANRAVTHASVDNLDTVGSLLRELMLAAGAAGQVTRLLDRDSAAQVSLDNPYDVAHLLDALREAGARPQVAELIERLPAAGQFQFFSEQELRAGQFRFGREADGRPAKPWAWTDISA